jgi:threonyl-tRNA synthetase
MSIFIEHTAGWLPFWCAPESVRVLTVNDSVEDYIGKITNILDGVDLDKPLRHSTVRYTVDRRNESVGKKIREAAAMKIPLIIIAGPRDAESEQVSVRVRDKEETVTLDKLAEYIKSL